MVCKKISGAGLLEIMIALLLSAIVLAEILRYSDFIERMLNVSALKVESIEKNNVLFAWMVRDIELAGYMGCVNASARKSIIDDGHYLSSTWLIANGNHLVSQYMSPQQFLVKEKVSDTEALIVKDNHFKEEDIVLIENCWEAETAKIKKIHSVNYGAENRLEFYSPLHLKNVENTHVAKIILHDYFINDLYGLYVRNEKGDCDEILENIANFTISLSCNQYKLSVKEFYLGEPIVLSASAYNAK